MNFLHHKHSTLWVPLIPKDQFNKEIFSFNLTVYIFLSVQKFTINKSFLVLFATKIETLKKNHHGKQIYLHVSKQAEILHLDSKPKVFQTCNA